METDARSRIDRAIDRLDDALRANGFDALAPAVDAASLEEVDRAIAPYSLPQDLRRFWECVDFSSLRVRSWSLPEPCGPATALATHRLNLDPEFRLLFGPPILFPIARSSGDQWSIELACEWNDGGIVFSHGYGPEFIPIEYPSFTDLVEVYAELLAEGRFDRWDNGYGSLDRHAERERREARLCGVMPESLYGDVREIGPDPGDWPAHWLAAAGLDPRDRTPLGVTHTIAQVVRESEQGPVHARIAGTVDRVVGLGGDRLLIVSDGTGSLDVWCPAGTTHWGLAASRRFEFEVALEEPVRALPDLDTGHRELQDHALAGRIEDASAAAAGFFDGIASHRPAAIASAIRPLD